MEVENNSHIVWNQMEFKLNFVIDNPNFKLPQVVKVVQGHMLDEDEALASGQVLTLHRKQKTDKFEGFDEHGKDISILFDCPYKVKIISVGEPRKFRNMREVCFCDDLPQYIRPVERVCVSDGVTFEEHTTLEVLELVFKDSDVIGLQCSVDSKLITLPISFCHAFEEDTAYVYKNDRYLLSEVVNKFGTPVQVQFLAATDRNCGYGPQMGTLTLNKKISQNSILATSVIDGVTFALEFPADLPVTIQAAKEIVAPQVNLLEGLQPPLSNQPYDEIRTPRMSVRCKSSESLHSSKCRPSPLPLQREPKMERNQLKRNKSMDFGKDVERFVKLKLGFKSLRRSMSKLRDKPVKKLVRSASNTEFDTHSTYTCVTSDDGNSSTGACSIDVTSTGSNSTCNESFQSIMECMDALSMSPATEKATMKNSRKSSGDSGICLSKRRTRSQNDTKSGASHESFSDWCVSNNAKKHPTLSLLWSAEDKNNNTDSKELPRDMETKSQIDLPDTQIAPANSAQKASLHQIKNLNESGVCRILDALRLNQYKNEFQRNQVNGELLVCLELDEIISELKLSMFEAKKLMKYLNGWRPESEGYQSIETSRRNSLNPRDWSESDVLLHMKTINLKELGEFCLGNQVNGELLIDILDKNTLRSIQEDHGVKISSFDSKKLLNFVVKGWRPDSSARRPAN